LKEQRDDIVIALTDPHGASLYEYYAYGELRAEGSSVSEGIGQSRVTANLESAPVDTQFRISDEAGLEQLFALLKQEGLCLGLSSGINVAGAMALAREMGPGHTIVTILCDSGMRYLSTVFNPAWLRAKGLHAPDWLRR
jgi:cysteine synthase A